MKTTSRKQRKEEALKRRQYQIEAWVDEMKEHLASGKSYKEACDIMSAETAEAISMFPQIKHELLAAWKDFFSRIHRITKETMKGNTHHEP
jgi:hypothetical protein